jgi:hypothetical protein
LKKCCSSVKSEFISDGKKPEPDGLFILWQGTRKC